MRALILSAAFTVALVFRHERAGAIGHVVETGNVSHVSNESSGDNRQVALGHVSDESSGDSRQVPVLSEDKPTEQQRAVKKAQRAAKRVARQDTRLAEQGGLKASNHIANITRMAGEKKSCSAALTARQAVLSNHGGQLGPWTERSSFTTSKAWDKINAGQDVVVATVGGSSSTGAGLPYGNPGSPEAIAHTMGPHTVAQLNAALDGCDPAGGLGRFVNHNMAHGFGNSWWSSMVFDSQVQAADIVIWEFAINDQGLDDRALALDAWMRKASALPSRPEIYLVYFTLRDSHIEVWPAQAAIRRKYMSGGFDVASFSMRKYLDALGQDWHEFLADYHHPKEQVHVLASNFVAHQILSRRTAPPATPTAPALPALSPISSLYTPVCSNLLRVAGSAPSTSAIAWEPHLYSNDLGGHKLFDTLADPGSRTGWPTYGLKKMVRVPCCKDGGIKLNVPHGKVTQLNIKGRGGLRHFLETPTGETEVFAPRIVGGQGSNFDKDANPDVVQRGCSMLRAIMISGHYSYWMQLASGGIEATSWSTCSTSCLHLAEVSWMVSFGTEPVSFVQSSSDVDHQAADPKFVDLETQSVGPYGGASFYSLNSSTSGLDLGAYGDAVDYHMQEQALLREEAVKIAKDPSAGAIEAHTLQAAGLAAVLGAGFLLTLWVFSSPVESEKPAARWDVLDNAKLIAMVLVIMAHFIDSLMRTGEEWAWAAEVKLCCKFHTRTFCFVSGLLTRKYTPGRSVRGVVLGVIAPAVLVCTVLQPFLFPLAAGELPKLDTALGLARDLLLYPAGPVWYLFALAQWRLLGFAFLGIRPDMRLILAILLSSVSGYVPLPLFRTGTALLFFPVFVAGQIFPLQAAHDRVAPSAASFAVGALCFLAIFAWEFYAIDFLDSMPFLDGWSGASHRGATEAGLFWVRALCRNLVELTKVLLLLIFCCPRSFSFITTLGSHTLYPFLLHIPVLTWRTWLMPLPATLAPVIVLWMMGFAFCFAVAVVLAQYPVRAVFGVLLEPTWLAPVWPIESPVQKGTPSGKAPDAEEKSPA